jgi:hypothetical protein
MGEIARFWCGRVLPGRKCPGFGRTLLGMLTIALALCAARPARADSESSLTEYQVEAAFLYHFAKYVTWPPQAFANPDDPILIGVLGDDPFGDDLVQTVRREKPVQGRSLRIVRGRNPAELARCHILFISASEAPRLKQHLEALARAHSTALTVGESKDFLDVGGAIRFVVEKNKVRFEIAARAAERAGLSLSSKLLSLARNTRERG